MGRMASMQVLNQAFANANAAFNAYMRNKNEQRINDLNEEFGRLDRQYRAEQARQRQSNLDRMYELAINRDKQAQANWQAAFDTKLADSAAAKRANNMGAITKVLSVAKDAPTANVLINGLGVGFEDPVLQGTFLNDYYNNKKLNDIGKQLNDYQSLASKLQLARAKQQQQAVSEQRTNKGKIDPASIFTMCVKNGMSAEEAFDTTQKAELWFNGNGSDAGNVLQHLTGGNLSKNDGSNVADTFAASVNNIPQQTETLSQREAKLNQMEAETRAKYKPGTAAVINTARRFFPRTAGIDSATPSQVYSPFGL